MNVDYSFAQLPTTLAINRLPLVITGPGDYKTRDGQRVTIHRIVMYAPRPHDALRHEVTVFEAKGLIWKMYRGQPRPRTPDIWHLSGRILPAGEQPRDIVGYWECPEFDQFLRGYMTALWWSTSDEVDGEEVHLDEFEPSEDAVRKCTKDCFHFFWANKHDLDKAAARYDLSRGDGADTGYDFAGHDFALTRNGHGVGFWDRKELSKGDLGDRLTKACEAAGEVYAYLGDDKLIYIGRPMTIKTIIKDGRTFRFDVKQEPDLDHPHPWNAEEGHGPVSEWSSRKKKPGEWVLEVDGRQRRFYDFSEAVEIAKRDGWGIPPEEMEAWITERDGIRPTKAMIATRAVARDFVHLKAFCDDEWTYVGVIVTLLDGEDDTPTKVSAMRWGLETSVPNIVDDTAQELVDELVAGFGTSWATCRRWYPSSSPTGSSLTCRRKFRICTTASTCCRRRRTALAGCAASSRIAWGNCRSRTAS